MKHIKKIWRESTNIKRKNLRGHSNNIVQGKENAADILFELMVNPIKVCDCE